MIRARFVFALMISPLSLHVLGSQLGIAAASIGWATDSQIPSATQLPTVSRPSSGQASDGGTVPCGPACLASAFALLDIEIRNDELSSLCHGGVESDFAQLEAYARSKGLNTAGVRLTPGQLYSLRHLAILQLDTKWGAPDEQNAHHFSLFAGLAKPPQDGSAIPDPSAPFVEAQEEMAYVFDPIARHGARGGIPMSKLGEYFTGNALILSRHPIVIPALERFGPIESRRLPTVLGCIATATAIAAALLIRTRYRRGVRNIGASCIVVAILMSCLTKVVCASVNGPSSRPLPPQSDKHERASPYVVGPLTYNAGTVSKGELIRHEFALQNPHSSPVTIGIDAKSCQCTEAKLLGNDVLQPGGKAKVAIAVLAVAGGQLTQGIILNVSSSKEPIPLAISATVADDTRIAPREVDFGDILAGSGRFVRPVHLLHYGRAGETFVLDAIDGVKTFLTCVPSSPTIKRDGESVRHEQSIEITLDSNLCKPGAVFEVLTLRAHLGKTPLTFHVTCTCRVISPVSAQPSQIVRIGRSLPDVWEAEVALSTHIGGRVAVDSVKAIGLVISDWSLSAASPSTPALLKIQFRSKFSGGRVVGTCSVHLKEPAALSIDIPVRLVDTARKEP